MKLIRRLLLLTSLLMSGCSTTYINPGDWFHPGPQQVSPETLAKLARDGYTASLIHFAAADGSISSGVLLRQPQANAIVLYVGGGSFTPARDLDKVGQTFENMRLDALILQFPAYPAKDAEEGLEAARLAALGAYDHLDDHSDNRLPVIVHGYDMGSFIASYVAVKRAVSGLVLESAPTSLRDWAHAQAPWYGRAFSAVKMRRGAHEENNLAAVNSYAGPLLILSGADDTDTPPLFAKALMRYSLTPKSHKILVSVPGAGHTDTLANKHAREVYQRFVRNIAQTAPTVTDGG